MSKVKLRGSRLEAEVDRCRVEGNWRRLHEMLPWLRAGNSGMTELAEMIAGEVQLEMFIDQHAGECVRSVAWKTRGMGLFRVADAE
jgi:hypothetical protein